MSYLDGAALNVVVGLVAKNSPYRADWPTLRDFIDTIYAPANWEMEMHSASLFGHPQGAPLRSLFVDVPLPKKAISFLQEASL